MSKNTKKSKNKNVKNTELQEEIYKSHDAIYGEKNLIAAILRQAIFDATLYKRPRPPEYRGLTKKHKRKLVILFNSCLLTLKNKYIYQANYSLTCIKFILSFFDKFLVKTATPNEEIAWEAREFINHKNSIFSYYAEAIDIDPLYLEKKIQKYIRKFDNGITDTVGNFCI